MIARRFSHEDLLKNRDRVMSRLKCNWLLFFAIVVLSASLTSGQGARTRSLPVTVHGQVRYAHGGAPAENVLVRLESFNGGLDGEMMTDRTGKFQFSGMPPAQYVIKIHLPGFMDQQRQVDLQTTTSDYVLFQLLPETKAADSVAPARTKLVDANVPAEAQREFERAQSALQSEGADRLDECARHLERAISIYPKFLEAELRLGTVYMDLNQPDKAERALRGALEINPNTPNAFFALGELKLQQKKYSESEKMLRDGLNLENRSWQGHFTLGRVYWNTGDLAKAGKQVAITLQLNPKLAEAHLLGANILLRAGKREDAALEFEEYLRLAPNGQYSDQVRETIRRLKVALNQKQ